MKIYQTKHNIIKCWADDADENTLEQAQNVADAPYTKGPVVLCADSHAGYGVSIGCVFQSDNVVVPNAVGIDIGCGMCLLDLGMKVDDIDVEQAVKDIYKTIPVGFNSHDDPQEMPVIGKTIDAKRLKNVIAIEKAPYQLGTLGGGNHFIEIQRDEEDNAYVMIHSGSRNLGKQIADIHNKVAQQTMEKYYSQCPPDLAFLSMDDWEGRHYYHEMQYCMKYAKKNRRLMLESVCRCLNCRCLNIDMPMNFLDVCHNFAHWDKETGLVTHHKGALHLDKGVFGVIPGSQGTCSYVVEGLGNRASYCSCSHGAGRRMGRKQAKRELKLEEQREKMKGIVHRMDNSNLDEAPDAYKDIDVVMENQKDLVEIVLKLYPVGVVKG